MLETIFNTTVTESSLSFSSAVISIFNGLATDGAEVQLSIGTALMTLITAFTLGLLIAFTYIKTHARGHYSQNFTLTLIMIPSIIAIIILLVGSNVARAFSLAGVFSIIRFRSAPGDPKDIAYVFFTVAAGLACGVGLYGYSALFTIMLCGFMTALSVTNFGSRKAYNKLLKIVIPEDLDYQGVFDEVFLMHTTKYELKKVRTTDLGTLFELVYVVSMKKDANEKEFIDELRCRNGNLNIVLSMNAETPDY
ncbi:UNVERIFIED_CONTAM: uncharacterized protein DUF4956 [Acetivibrio alkalicellulosi]